MPLVPHTPAADAEIHAGLIVALDAGDLDGPDLERVEAVLAACAGCSALRDDLAAIRGAMTALPVPARRRDFRLTEADAARLRPGGWRRVVGWLAAPRSAVRPLATGLATLGVVGLLLTAGLPGLGGGAAILSPVGDSVGGAESLPLAGDDGERANALQSLLPAEPLTAPGEQPVPGIAGEASPAAEQAREGEAPAAQQYDEAATTDAGASTGEPGPSAPLVASLLLLVAGLGLFLARAIALRRAA